jgi:hypothetical protein
MQCCQQWGAAPLYRILHLELRRRPMSREPRTRAASAPGRQPAAAGTEEGQGQRSQPRCRSGSPATEPSGPGANNGPSWTPPRTTHHTQLGPNTQTPSPTPNPAPYCLLDPGGERRPTPPPLAHPLIAQLVQHQPAAQITYYNLLNNARWWLNF